MKVYVVCEEWFGGGWDIVSIHQTRVGADLVVEQKMKARGSQHVTFFTEEHEVQNP